MDKRPWTFKVIKRKHGESIVLRFRGDDFATFEWYPPWQNDLMRANAKCVVDDLNAAFVARTTEGGNHAAI